jgi:hypothetical protein
MWLLSLHTTSFGACYLGGEEGGVLPDASHRDGRTGRRTLDSLVARGLYGATRAPSREFAASDRRQDQRLTSTNRSTVAPASR